jgi:hypothetical protein
VKIIRSVPLIPLLIASLVLAVIASDLTYHTPHFWFWRTNYVHQVFKVFLPALVWLLMVAAGLIAHGRRGLWLLLGSPFALYWPYMFLRLDFECWMILAPDYFMCD